MKKIICLISLSLIFLTTNIYAMTRAQYCAIYRCSDNNYPYASMTPTGEPQKHTYHYKKQTTAVKKERRSTGGGLASKRPGTGNRVFVFDPKIARYAAYDEGGNLVTSGRASGGRNYCPDIKRGCRTPAGTYRIQEKRGAGCKSTRFPVGRGGAPMPYCMFFNKNYAVHGSYEVRDYNASHGCIRISPSEAKWLNQNFLKMGSTVIVKSY